MTEVVYSPKIKPEHLARKAIVYLRQSSERQVRQNTESQLLQYAVAERVRALGWKQVEIINSDLGSSAGIASAQREGFERILSWVALGEVGIVGSREVSRLSRTDKDWCRLLEVCQIFGTLIADEQQVYDLNYLDDQLVLGIKGTLSVVELKVLRQRLLAGQESKARRGELFKRLPIGYARDVAGKVVVHPDRRIYEAIRLVFTRFRELWSVRQTFKWFRDHDVELPANPIQGTGLVWKIPSQSLIRDILCNPFYAGAYVWARRPTTTRLVDGRLEKRQGAMRSAEECRADNHPLDARAEHRLRLGYRSDATADLRGQPLGDLEDQRAIVSLAHGRVQIDQLHQRIFLEAADPIFEVVEGQLQFFAAHQLHDAPAHEIDGWNQHGSLMGKPLCAISSFSARASAMPK